MAMPAASLTRFDALVRPATTGVAAIVALLAWLSRPGGVVDTTLLGSTVGLFVLWAFVRRLPTILPMTMATATPILLNIIEVRDEVSVMFLVLSITYVMLFASRRRLALTYATTLIVTINVLFFTGVFDGFGIANWSFGLAFATAFGEVGFRLRATITELELTRAAMVEQATAHERRRIARDVHDLVGHSLAVVMLHVTGARRVLRGDPDEAERALVEAEGVGRASLVDIRRTIGLLRDTSEAGAGAPAPTLADLAELVDEFRLAGAAIDLTTAGEPASLDDAVSLAAYRIVQESLTNATRHAPGHPVVVGVEIEPDACNVVVRNTFSGPSPSTKPVGFGLVGIRERARSVGGSVSTGPTGSTWTVDVALPARLDSEIAT